MDLLTSFLTAALTANPLNLSLCAVITLSVAIIVITWKRN